MLKLDKNTGIMNVNYNLIKNFLFYIKNGAGSAISLTILWKNTKSNTIFFENPSSITATSGDYYV